jgi:uncharacterized protein YcfJ
MCSGGNGLLGALAGGALAYFTGGASLGLTAGGAIAAGAAVGGSIGNSVDQANIAKKGIEAQTTASNNALAQAKDTAAQTAAANARAQEAADKANNLALNKQPDANGMQSRNTLEAKGGASGTLLTGPQGVDPKTLLLGKTTLLGG